MCNKIYFWWKCIVFKQFSIIYSAEYLYAFRKRWYKNKKPHRKFPNIEDGVIYSFMKIKPSTKFNLYLNFNAHLINWFCYRWATIHLRLSVWKFKFYRESNFSSCLIMEIEDIQDNVLFFSRWSFPKKHILKIANNPIYSKIQLATPDKN